MDSSIRVKLSAVFGCEPNLCHQAARFRDPIGREGGPIALPVAVEAVDAQREHVLGMFDAPLVHFAGDPNPFEPGFTPPAACPSSST